MKLDIPKQDVLVHYDEDAGVLVFYAVDTARTGGLRASSFGGIRPTIDEMRELPSAEAMRRVGGTVLGILDMSSQVKTGIEMQAQPSTPQGEA